MPNLDNPAGRLLHLLEQGQELRAKNLTCEGAWALLLNPSGGKATRGGLLEGLALVFQLPDSISRAATRVKAVNREILLEWLPQVCEILGDIHMKEPWQPFIARFDKTLLYGLRICDDVLSRAKVEAVVKPRDLNDIQEKIWELHGDLEEAELDEDLKQWMLERLVMIEKAIAEHSLMGADPMVRAVEATVASAALKSPTIDTGSQAFSKFCNFLRWAGVVVGLTTGAIQIGKDATRLLTSDSDATQVVISDRDSANPDQETDPANKSGE